MWYRQILQKGIDLPSIPKERLANVLCHDFEERAWRRQNALIDYRVDPPRPTYGISDGTPWAQWRSNDQSDVRESLHQLHLRQGMHYWWVSAWQGWMGLGGNYRPVSQHACTGIMNETYNASKSLSSFALISPCIVWIRAHKRATLGIERNDLNGADNSFTA